MLPAVSVSELCPIKAHNTIQCLQEQKLGRRHSITIGSTHRIIAPISAPELPSVNQKMKMYCPRSCQNPHADTGDRNRLAKICSPPPRSHGPPLPFASRSAPDGIGQSHNPQAPDGSERAALPPGGDASVTAARSLPSGAFG